MFQKYHINNKGGIYLFKVSNGNNRTMCETCSKLEIKTPEQSQMRRSGVFYVSLEQISHSVLVFSFLTMNKQTPVRNSHNFNLSLPSGLSFN